MELEEWIKSRALSWVTKKSWNNLKLRVSITNKKTCTAPKDFFRSAWRLFESFRLRFPLCREEFTLNVNIWTGRLCYIVRWIAAAPRDRRHLAPPADIHCNSHHTTYTLFDEIPTGLYNSLNPRPELLTGGRGCSLSMFVITSNILALGKTRVLWGCLLFIDLYRNYAPCEII